MPKEIPQAMFPIKSADSTTVKPLSESDLSLLSELRNVLIRHFATERFGITLLHEPFQLQEGEHLIDTVDAASRTLTIKPSRIVDATNTVETAWRFKADTPDAIVALTCHPTWDWDYSVNPPRQVYRHSTFD